jgi:hypothetical protein
LSNVCVVVVDGQTAVARVGEQARPDAVGVGQGLAQPAAGWRAGQPKTAEIGLDRCHPQPLFYCDPCACWQKGRVERNHEFLRFVLPKGSSFDGLTQADVDKVLFHVSCAPCLPAVATITKVGANSGVDHYLGLVTLQNHDLAIASDLNGVWLEGGVTTDASGTRTIAVSGSGNAILGTTGMLITDGAGQIRIVKDGTGTLTFGGANTFTGTC